MASIVPIYNESDKFIGVWAQNRDFTPSLGSLGQLMGLAESTLIALTKLPYKRTDNYGIVRVFDNISFQDGMFLMIDEENLPTEDVRHSWLFRNDFAPWNSNCQTETEATL